MWGGRVKPKEPRVVSEFAVAGLWEAGPGSQTPATEDRGHRPRLQQHQTQTLPTAASTHFSFPSSAWEREEKRRVSLLPERLLEQRRHRSPRLLVGLLVVRHAFNHVLVSPRYGEAVDHPGVRLELEVDVGLLQRRPER